MNILKVYISKTGKKVNTDNLILNQNSYYNTLQLYTESYYPEVVCTFKDSNGKLSPKCHMIFKGKQQDEKYLYEYPIPFAITSFVIPNMSGRLDTSFVCYENKGGNLVYPTIANVSILVNKSNGNAVLDNSYNGTDVENLWKVVGDLILRTSPDGGDKQDVLIPGRYIEITKENIINVLPIDYSYITNRPFIPTKLSQLEQDIDISNIFPIDDPTLKMTVLKGLTINDTQYRLPAYDLSLGKDSVLNAEVIKNIHLNGKDYFVGGLTDQEKLDLQKQLDLKADKSNTYTIEQVNDKLLSKVNYDDIYSKDAIDNKLLDKANKSEVYSITIMDQKLLKKADITNVYNKSEINDKLGLKANKDDVYGKQDIDGKLANKVDTTTLTKNYYDKQQIDDKLTSSLTYKGSVPTVDDLPKSGNKVGDFWNVLEDDTNYAWDGKRWDKIGGSGGTADLKNYYNKQQIDAKEKVLQTDINSRLLTSVFETYKFDNDAAITDINKKFGDYYTSVTVNALLADKADKDNVYDIATIDGKLALKANANNVYTQSEINDFLATKANVLDVYDRTTLNSKFDAKADKNNVYTIEEMTGLLEGKQPKGDYPYKSDFKTVNNESIFGIGNIDTGTDVLANIELLGGEALLESLQVSGVRYKVGAENMVFSETAVPGAYKLRNIRIKGDNWAIAGDGSSIKVDDTLSETSINPVENQAITKEINSMKPKLNAISVDELNSMLVIE